jgi:hypothetical protein
MTNDEWRNNDEARIPNTGVRAKRKYGNGAAFELRLFVIRHWDFIRQWPRIRASSFISFHLIDEVACR